MILQLIVTTIYFDSLRITESLVVSYHVKDPTHLLLEGKAHRYTGFEHSWRLTDSCYLPENLHVKASPSPLVLLYNIFSYIVLDTDFSKDQIHPSFYTF